MRKNQQLPVSVAQQQPRMTPQQIRKVLLSTRGLIFYVSFIKRSDNTLRKMTARINVKPPLSPNPQTDRRHRDIKNNLLTVYEMGPNGGYKCIPLDSIIDLRAAIPPKTNGPPLRSNEEIQKEQWDYIHEQERRRNERTT